MTQEELSRYPKGDEMPHGVLILAGEERYLIRHYLTLIRKRILQDPSFASFNHMVYEGAEIDFASLFHALGTPPVFAEGKLVEWHLPRLDDFKEGEISQMLDLAAEAEETGDTLIVLLPDVDAFDVGSPKRPSTLYKKLSPAVEIVLFPKSTDGQLINWLGRHFAHEGVEVETNALREMLERCGHGMDVLAEETAKLVAYARGNNLPRVTVDVVRYVTCPSTEEDAFGLTNALMNLDGKAAFENLADLKSRRVEPTILLAQIGRFFSDMLSVALFAEAGCTSQQIATKLKINEYKVKLYMKAARQYSTPRLKGCVTLCREADAQVKLSYGVDAYAAIERLVAALLA